MVNAESQTPNRRRSRQQVESDVRAALLRLLAEGKPFKDLTVDELARASGLSRTAFYFYFPGKTQVLMAAANEVAQDYYSEADRWWSGEGPPQQLVRAAMEGVVGAYVRHKAVLRTSVEVATYDPEFAVFYDGLLQRFVTATADQLRRDRDAGLLRPIDPQAVAETLVWMVERCNHMLIGTQGRPPQEVVESFVTVWVRALYPDEVIRSAVTQGDIASG
jgi:AcrR family transcriptional regulator